MNSGIREAGGCIVIGIVRPTNETIINPDPNIVLNEDDIIILAGEKQKIHNFFDIK
jgi:K+/H+ antiporter YhaU regulatory subunit KhtT